MFAAFRQQQPNVSPFLLPASASCVMFDLPTEIVQEVGRHLSPVDLKQLSSASKALRDALLPLMVKDVSIMSMAKLKSLAEGSSAMIDLIRNLNVTLNIEFFDAWTHDDTAPLATILSHASRLQSLTFQASNSPYDTPWNRLNVQDDSLRGISLGLEGLPVDSLPIFDRLTHLELQTLSTCNLEILLSRAPNLSSLAITLPDGLSETEIAALLSSLRHVPKLKELTVSVADWEPCTGSNETALVGEVLRVIAQRLPSLEILDLRTKSYDMVDGILSYTCVQLDWLSFEDFAPIIPLFSNLRALRLPLQSRKRDATVACKAIAERLPLLESISWMHSVTFQCMMDEYTISRNPETEEVSVTRIGLPSSEVERPIVLPARRGLALFDTLFSNFVAQDKPGVLSDIAVSVTALMVVSSMVFSPILMLFGY
ncbi:hypothetical protein FRC04_006376 [Tulasnella sp. 424]|nr:hypothetical protein FRC04_006376 [Tulasnella sp. 424]KAG8980427.1 hypothetical protein FRC05_006059 [Tulasnella sp. 425]